MLIGVTVVSLAVAPSAKADDAAFVQVLADNGIRVTGSPLLIGNEGRQICAFATNYGYTASALRYVPIGNHPGMTDGQADKFVALAMETYCPS